MLKLTSVKLLDNLYKKFKVSNLDDKFKTQIHEWKNLELSGSRL